MRKFLIAYKILAALIHFEFSLLPAKSLEQPKPCVDGN